MGQKRLRNSALHRCSPKAFVMFGEEKSSISLLKITPVLSPRTLLPKLKKNTSVLLPRTFLPNKTWFCLKRFWSSWHAGSSAVTLFVSAPTTAKNQHSYSPDAKGMQSGLAGILKRFWSGRPSIKYIISRALMYAIVTITIIVLFTFFAGSNHFGARGGEARNF